MVASYDVVVAAADVFYAAEIAAVMIGDDVQIVVDVVDVVDESDGGVGGFALAMLDVDVEFDAVVVDVVVPTVFVVAVVVDDVFVAFVDEVVTGLDDAVDFERDLLPDDESADQDYVQNS